jgi:hypothetical protein
MKQDLRPLNLIALKPRQKKRIHTKVASLNQKETKTQRKE